MRAGTGQAPSQLTREMRQELIGRLFKAKATAMSAQGVEHECCSDPRNGAFCNPENAARLVSTGKMDAAYGNSNPGFNAIYLCDLWGIHECTGAKCRLWHTAGGTCPISGLVHGVMMVSDRHQDGDRVHVFKAMSRQDQVERDRKAAANSSTIRLTRKKSAAATPLLKRGAAAVTEEAPVALSDETLSNIDDLGLVLMETLVSTSLEGSELRFTLEETLMDTTMPLKDKISAMAVSLRMYAEETSLKTTKAVVTWVTAQIADYKECVSAAVAEATEAARPSKGPTRKRRLIASTNMFGGNSAAVVVEEEVDCDAELAALAEKKRERRRRYELKETTLQRRPDGSLIIADKRGDDEDDDSELDEEERLAALKERTHRAAPTPEMTARFRKKTRHFIEHLLYGKPRAEIVERHRVESAKTYNRVYQRYLSHVQRKRISHIESMEIAFNSMREPPITLLKYDSNVINKYVDIVVHVWTVVATHGPATYRNAGDRVCVYATLATLYCTRGNGLTVGGVTMLPRNRQMLNLPHLNDLRLFRLKEHDDMPSYSRSYTLGREIVKSAFQAAIDKGVAAVDLQLNLKQAQAESVRKGGKVVDDTVVYIPVGRSNRAKK